MGMKFKDDGDAIKANCELLVIHSFVGFHNSFISSFFKRKMWISLGNIPDRASKIDYLQS